MLQYNDNQPKLITEDELKSRFAELSEIYNEEMSPTKVELGMDSFVAVKHIYKDQLLDDIQRKQALFECQVHYSMHHDQIVQLYESFQTDKRYTLILEFMNDANHFKDKIDEQLRSITRESKMKSYMIDILEGLSYIHKNCTTISYLAFIHCDIKLENLFCEKIEDEVYRNVKIADLGLVHAYDINTGQGIMPVRCGTASYIAPEVSNNAVITPKIDIWSLGIILYKMSCGYKPTQIQGFKYGQGPIPFRKFDWKKRSPELQQMITSMLEMDPTNRPDCEELLKNPWFEIDS